MAYRGKQEGSYGNQKHHRGFWHLGRKSKDYQYEAEDYRDNDDREDREEKPIENPLEAPNQEIPISAQVWLCNSKSFFTQGFAVPLSSVPEVQPKIASDIKQIAPTQKEVFIESLESHKARLLSGLEFADY